MINLNRIIKYYLILKVKATKYLRRDWKGNRWVYTYKEPAKKMNNKKEETKSNKETKLTTKNGSFLKYTIYEDRIDIDNIKSNKKGDGTILIKKIKEISREKSLPIELVSKPQDSSISQEDLNSFYRKNGFELHPDDVDNSYFTWG